jgi:putative transposase
MEDMFMEYRRAYIPGGSFFFTLVTESRRPILQSAETVDVLREAFRNVRATRPFELEAVVILPDHLHCIWTLPPEDWDFATRWRLFKTWFTKHCDPSLRSHPNHSRFRKKQQAIWQHRYWEHMLRNEADFMNHVEYVHYNPVKHGYVRAPIDWPYSSFHRYVDRGAYSRDWGCGEMLFDSVGHE